MSSSTSTIAPSISKGENEGQVIKEIEALYANGWKLNENEELEKTYGLKTYTKVNVGSETAFDSCCSHL
jgi:hypothetical protein